MKKTSLKLAIASSVLAASSVMALDNADVFVDLLIGTTANLTMTSTSIFLSDPGGAPAILTGSATGCAYSSSGAFTASMSSLNGGFLIGSAGAIPYSASFSGSGANTVPSCGGVDNLSVDVSVNLLGTELTGTYSDIINVLITPL